MTLTRRTLIASAILTPFAARAHHGYMRWDEENPIAIEGWISKEMDGFPHWEIDVRVAGVDWEVDVGDPWALKKAGLKDDGSDFTVGREVRVEGLRPMEKNILRILPRKVIFDGDKEYPLYVEG